MSVLRTLLALAAVALLVWAQGCDRTIDLVESPDGQPLSCAECHDATNLITEKATSWAASRHGMGTSYVRGTSASCAGCHAGNAFAEMIAMGLDPDELSAGNLEPTRQDCRACHLIHETYSLADFALRTEQPVTLFAFEGATYDGGEGNLCVNCHQPRRVIPEPDSTTGIISGITTHWGPHHGPQSAMLLGIGGAGDVQGTPHGHYGGVVNTCVDCHMGEGRDHLFAPDVDNCIGCHPTIGNFEDSDYDFDYENIQTEIAGLIDQLGELLLNADPPLINENTEDGHPAVEEAPEDQAVALWNWLYVSHEDKSLGVHNADYARALLEEGITRMGGVPGR